MFGRFGTYAYHVTVRREEIWGTRLESERDLRERPCVAVTLASHFIRQGSTYLVQTKTLSITWQHNNSTTTLCPQITLMRHPLTQQNEVPNCCTSVELCKVI